MPGRPVTSFNSKGMAVQWDPRDSRDPGLKHVKWDDGLAKMDQALEEAGNAAKVGGVWQSDSSRHGVERRMTGESSGGVRTAATPRDGHPTLRMAYLFSGPQRKSSIAQHLQKLCEAAGFGLEVDEIDILVGGSEHDLLSSDAQEAIMARISAGDYDIVILSPPCSTWSRARFSDKPGPGPVRNRQHPWGIPHLQHEWMKRHARDGNTFIHFSIRAIAAAQGCKRRGFRVMTLLEHPEDLGRTKNGVPASIWQLQELRKAYAEFPFVTAAGHQCQFDVDWSKPTRLLSDILSIAEFGHSGWPTFTNDDWYAGPLPRSCGHTHFTQTIGTLPGGGHATSPFAAYPDKMCEFLARHILNDFVANGRGKCPPGGWVVSSVRRRTLAGQEQSSSSKTGPGGDHRKEFAGKSINGKEGSVPNDKAVEEEGLSHISCLHLRGSSVIVAQDEIEKASRALDEKGIDRPLREGLDDSVPKLVPEDDDDDSGDATDLDPPEETTDEETELPGTIRPKRGEGWWGRGSTLRPQRKGIVKTFYDGAGLPSPGRWAPKQRRLPEDEIATELRRIFKEGLAESTDDLPGGSLKTALAALSAGKVSKSPFPIDIVEKSKTNLRIALKRAGFDSGLPCEGDVCQVTEVRLLQSLLRAFLDPDHHFCEWWARGVWIGSPERRLPRTPAIFERKTKWPVHDASNSLHGQWKANYPSMTEHERQVLKQFKEEVDDGMMVIMTLEEALETYGESLLLAATGAIAKKGQGPGGEVRVIFDGTNGVFLNVGVKIRDQIRFPTAPDLKAVIAELAEAGGSYVMLMYDIKKAHRRIPVLRSEWGRQACQIKGSAACSAQLRRSSAKRRLEGSESANGMVGLRKEDFSERELREDVYLNCVGTFGVTSAGYWWGRAAAAIVRLTHYALGHENALWALIYSDDGNLMSGEVWKERSLILHLFVLVVLGVPLAWHKVRGGVEAEWIGYWLDLGRFELGVSALRAASAASWLNDRVREGSAQLGELLQGIGKIGFITGAVEFLRPFLGPLYAWASAGPWFARSRLPPMILLIMKYLAKELLEVRMMPCEQKAQQLGEVFRMDAKAEGDTVVIGGWKSQGGCKTSEAPWFSVALTRATAPWAFARGEPFRTIASLELLGSLVGLMVLVPRTEQRGETAAVLSLSCGTDNQGNSHLLDRMLTTKYPLGVVLMELAHQMRIRRLVLRAHWLPRLENEEADALTNFDFRHFDPAKRVEVKLEDLEFAVLNELFAAGEEYVKALEDAKSKEKERRAKLEATQGSAKQLKKARKNSRQALARRSGT